jgi:hypothetical protein
MMFQRRKRQAGDVPRAVLEAVAHRHGHRCAVCGRRCGPGDTWRHTHPTMRGGANDPADFSLLCAPHREAAIRVGVRPARYLFRFPAGPRTLAILGTAWRWLVLVLGSVAYAGFVAAVLFAVWKGNVAHQPFWVIGWLMVVLLLFMVAGNIALVLQGRGHEIGAERRVYYHQRVN